MTDHGKSEKMTFPLCIPFGEREKVDPERCMPVGGALLQDPVILLLLNVYNLEFISEKHFCCKKSLENWER